MSRQFINEVNRMKDLFGYKRGVVISEQVNTQRTNYLSPLELKQNVGNKTGVQAFQDWLDLNHKGWHSKYQTLDGNVPKGYGKFGPNTNTAWITYKKEYLEKNPNLATDAKTIPLTSTTGQTAQSGQTTVQSGQTAQSGQTTVQSGQTEQPAPGQQLINLTPKANLNTPENFYKTLYDKGLFTSVGGGRIKYKGPDLTPEQLQLLNKAFQGMGYGEAKDKGDKSYGQKYLWKRL